MSRSSSSTISSALGRPPATPQDPTPGRAGWAATGHSYSYVTNLRRGTLAFSQCVPRTVDYVGTARATVIGPEVGGLGTYHCRVVGMERLACGDGYAVRHPPVTCPKGDSADKRDCRHQHCPRESSSSAGWFSDDRPQRDRPHHQPDRHKPETNHAEHEVRAEAGHLVLARVGTRRAVGQVRSTAHNCRRYPTVLIAGPPTRPSIRSRNRGKVWRCPKSCLDTRCCWPYQDRRHCWPRHP